MHANSLLLTSSVTSWPSRSAYSCSHSISYSGGSCHWSCFGCSWHPPQVLGWSSGRQLEQAISWGSLLSCESLRPSASPLPSALIRFSADSYCHSLRSLPSDRLLSSSCSDERCCLRSLGSHRLSRRYYSCLSWACLCGYSAQGLPSSGLLRRRRLRRLLR